MLSQLKDTRPILETMAHLGTSKTGKTLIELLERSYIETANSVMYRTESAEIYMQHGYMQCLNDLTVLLRDAPIILEQNRLLFDDAGLQPTTGHDDKGLP